MTDGTRVLTLPEFLLAYIVGEASEPDGAGPADRRLAHLRREVERHERRTVTVVTGDVVETITRCRSCPGDQGWPCTALRVLAMPYARHPAYREEWQVRRGAHRLVGAEDRSDR
jgi:hypothetical protein